VSLTEVLEGVGVDPDRTPVDSLPSHAQWALAYEFYSQEQCDEFQDR
jgi:hypothetical protein